ncbi:MAG: DUF1566 domain-containing protein [Saprospiraceae bacterium]|nr:DUF1566 domain-containing protein [Candidatus Opimibacter iunctus]
MKKSVVIAFVLSLTIISLDAQTVEVIGKLKVSEMDTLNGETMLVVKKADGTLATRMSSSLPPAPDTIRSLQSDLLLTSALCNCTSLPPAMIQSLLDNGYSIQDLNNFEVPILDLLGGGVTIQELLDAGITIQQLLDGGLTPIALFNGGVALNSLYGKTYGGGLIFYLNTTSGAGLVTAPPLWYGNNPDPSVPYGCFFSDIPGADGTAIGTGAQNTIDIEAGCATSGIAADICANLVLNGFNDWFLPSKDELNQMYLKVGQGATGPNQNIAGFSNNIYWSSSELSLFEARLQVLTNGIQGSNDKDYYNLIRPIRGF